VIYLDTSYLARLYLKDPGWEKVRELAARDQICCSLHGQAEAIAAFHRKFREGFLTRPEVNTLLRQFRDECGVGAIHWFPLSPSVVERVWAVYAKLPSSLALRAADALHLACAAEHSFDEIYSNDDRLLAAAGQFGLKAMNII
jgi:predicted nucleic acid-binding protein